MRVCLLALITLLFAFQVEAQEPSSFQRWSAFQDAYTSAEQAFSNEDWTTAKKGYQLALHMIPEASWARCKLGATLIKQGKLVEGRAFLTEAIEQYELWGASGFSRRREVARCHEWFAEAAEVDPEQDVLDQVGHIGRAQAKDYSFRRDQWLMSVAHKRGEPLPEDTLSPLLPFFLAVFDKSAEVKAKLCEEEKRFSKRSMCTATLLKNGPEGVSFYSVGSAGNTLSITAPKYRLWIVHSSGDQHHAFRTYTVSLSERFSLDFSLHDEKAVIKTTTTRRHWNLSQACEIELNESRLTVCNVAEGMPHCYGSAVVEQEIQRELVASQLRYVESRSVDAKVDNTFHFSAHPDWRGLRSRQLSDLESPAVQPLDDATHCGVEVPISIETTLRSDWRFE